MASKKGNPKARLEDIDSSDDRSISTVIFRGGMVLFGGWLAHYSGLIGHLLYPTQLNHRAYLMGNIGTAIIFLCILTLLGWKYIVQKDVSYRHLRIRAKRFLKIIVFVGFVTFVAHVVALWPVYGFKGIALLSILSYCLLCALSFV